MLAAIVDAMVTGRATPIILLGVRPLSGLRFAGRRNARRALDSNLLLRGANPRPHNIRSHPAHEPGAVPGLFGVGKLPTAWEPPVYGQKNRLTDTHP